jgi:hypothetical protein
MKYISKMDFRRFKAFNITYQEDDVIKNEFQKEFLASNYGLLKKIKILSLHNQEYSCR